MADALQVHIITTAGQTLTEEAVALRAPGEGGDVGVLRNHAPLVSVLRPGKLVWRTADGARQTARIGGGLMEVAKNRVTILTDSLDAPAKPEEAARP